MQAKSAAANMAWGEGYPPTAQKGFHLHTPLSWRKAPHACLLTLL